MARDKYERAQDRLDPISTCRSCKAMVTGDDGVKYGVRHYLCHDCAIRRGIEFLKTLKTWQLERLPAIRLKRAGLFEEVARLVMARKRDEVYEWADREREPEEIARRTGLSRMQVVTLLAHRQMELEKLAGAIDARFAQGR